MNKILGHPGKKNKFQDSDESDDDKALDYDIKSLLTKKGGVLGVRDSDSEEETTQPKKSLTRKQLRRMKEKDKEEKRLALISAASSSNDEKQKPASLSSSDNNESDEEIPEYMKNNKGKNDF